MGLGRYNAINLQNPATQGGLNAGLLNWWMATGRHGNRLFDLMNKDHLTLTAIPTWGGSRTRRGGIDSVSTNGSSSYLTSSSSSLDSNTQATIAGWVFRNATNTNNAFGFGASASSSRFGIIWYNDNNIYWQVDGTTPSTSTGITGWHHLIQVYNNAETPKQRVYIDGLPAALTGGTTSATSLKSAALLAAFWAGREIANGYCTGSYDDMRVYNRAISTDEAWRLYNEARTGYPTTLNRIRGTRAVYKPAATGNRRRRALISMSGAA